jgi:hypothetical protein
MTGAPKGWFHMADCFERDEVEDLQERIIRIENSLFCLRAKSKCFPTWDNSEIERLERLRSNLGERYESLHVYSNQACP